ncbi:Molybdopterin or thiamine biosynthesis adenylyltransferase [Paracoccus aminovorans]|uniref:Molybdopterin or thiamine biosynthesis adenylyltransferase n=1 Tax=Paracoccus aminovorans TaxID=34004 RepID=A0A1I3BCZ5_9RHOB|nr:HesA/MoeB/ThiF family protein [Paracoccus aminovorans]CQR84765.1 thiazole biosynthesis protein ThiF [Paracoccus aminovorans]SFH60177.1 Molybdopterin or thiamine biosynthesis adenylyltransferase [Paracoccus aminovorans]
MNRYARQMVLPEVGAEGQERIAAAHVLVVGAGGLGVPVLQYLAGAGIGRITLVDPDTVEESNLHRQPLYRMKDIGQPKVRAAALAVARLNPAVEIEALVDRLTPLNAPALIAAADVVLDCADSYAASYTLSDACLAAGKPLISASALGLSGYVGGFCGDRRNGGAPSLRALFPDPPDSGQTCATAGVLGPVVGMLGCIQAQMALRLILGTEPSPLGEFVRLDSTRFSQFRFDTAPETYGPRFVAREEIGSADLVIDLRPEDEAPRKATPQALRIPGYGATGPLPEPGRRVVLACRSGLRSWRAADALSRRWDGEITLLALGDDA